MSNLTMTLYILKEINKYCTCDRSDDFNFWIIETEEKQFWFNEDGSYYGTITKIPELEDC